jgi:hypothetical protein
MMAITLLLAVGALPWTSPSDRHPVNRAEDACTVASARVIERDQLPQTAIAFCDHVPTADSPPGYFIMALHSDRDCEGVCSSNMGWFAVQKSTGDVFEWNVAEWALARPVGLPDDR